jgi:predicted GIY-YIG superfamily endonuclease
MNISFTWEPKNSIPKEGRVGGVYLLVFKGTPKRVIYVGQTQDFRERLKQHWDAFLSGKRSIWRVEDNQDIYELMSYNGEKEAYKYYASLAKKGLLWAATDINQKEPINQLYKKDNFIENWLTFVRNKYVVNIEAWVCKTPDDKELRIRIESQIQNAIRSYYSIGSHIHHHVNDMCFLGKVDLPDKNSSITFTNAPDISDEFTMVLQNQLENKASIYLKPKIAQKKAEAAAKIKALRETYNNAGKGMSKKERYDLLACFKSGVHLNEIVRKFSRPHDEIVQRYITLVENNENLPKLEYE